jgi:hypothetical protein
MGKTNVEVRDPTSYLVRVGGLKELEGNLMRPDAGQLAQHPMVRQLVAATHGQ